MVASDLFYREGINSVGVDQIVRAAHATRATLYRHFQGKEALVVAYLEREDDGFRALVESGSQVAETPRAALELALEGIADDARRHHTRGCPFINATAEFPDPDSAVRLVVTAHRAWFRSQLEMLLAAAGVADPVEVGEGLVMLRDAVLIGSYLDDPDRARQAFLRNARRLVGTA
ncbi:TetR family transcriptional regulator [Conyzicola nivalis]|uniref:TetR family transcriptional regulator n=1 Tax=Conyzicola nivalis TaxID=1477021 RepID=A0A916SC45_9MICO|nr:TetR family transcriptional regulator [Conyzicola nivalis]